MKAILGLLIVLEAVNCAQLSLKDARIDDLEGQQIINRSRLENWQTRAMRDEQTIEDLQKAADEAEIVLPDGLELVDKLQSIRDVLGVKLKVTSGYRCITHNAKVHGSSHSKHLYGFAADWRTLDRVVNPVALGIIAQAVGFGGIGIYWHSEAAMCHADTRAGKATWLCTSPGVYPSTTYNSFILPTIRQGSVGAANRSAIILLQKLLKIKEDGNFGPATTQALLSAQKQNGLVADGICGPASWKKLSGADKYLAKL